MRKIHAKLCKEVPLYRLWHEHSLSEATHWFAFILISLSVTTGLLANIQKSFAGYTPSSFTVSQVGCGYALTALSYNGASFADPAQNQCINIREIQDTNGNRISLGADQGTLFDPQSNTVTLKFSQGSASIQFIQNGPSVDMRLSVTNNTSADIGYLAFHVGGLNITGYTGDSLPMSQGGDYPNIWGVNTTYGEIFFVNTNKVTGDCGNPSPWCLMSTSISNIPHGTTVTATNAIKFYPLGTSLLEAVPEVIAAWKAQYPMQNFWSDRRPIGTDFLSSPPCPIYGCSVDFSKNMNGWFSNGSDPGNVDVTTSAGRQAWATQMLARIDADIANVKEVNGQGVILWDLEGQRWPHCTSYIGDPRYAEDPRFAPEWDTKIAYSDPGSGFSSSSMNVIDVVFHKIRDNGLKSGITIRPDEITYDPNNADLGCGGGGTYGIFGIRPSQKYLTDTNARIKLLEDKINFAKNRWGVTIFYIDSTDWIAGTDMIKLHKDIPDVLLIPENTTLLEYSVGLPFKYTNKQGFYGGPGKIGNIGDIYPRAGAALNANNEQNEFVNHYWELVDAIRNGSLSLFNSWYNGSEKPYIKMVYAAAALPVVAPTVSTGASAVGDTNATLNGIVSATGGTYVITRGFEYGPTTSYGSSVKADGAFDVNLNNIDANFNLSVTGLTCGTTYHYRAFAKNFSGGTGLHTELTGYGADQTFTTTGTGCGTTNPPPSSDTTGPSITSFAIPSTSASLTVPVTFTAVDNVGVAAYLIKETSTVPSLGDTAWSGSVPTSYTFGSSGSKTLYAWVMDAAGNISASKSATVVINIVVAPTTYILTYTAGPDGSITGTSPQSVTAGANGSSVTAVANSGFHFVSWSDGITANPRTDNNVSRDITVTASFTQNTTTGGDTTSPVVTVFTIPSTSITATVPITAYSATDNVGVTGYLVSESSTIPSVTSASWKTAPLTSYTFKMTTGSRTLYAWAKDAAGNISAAKTASIKFNIRGGGKK
ncbi:MAG: hypothetical protein PHG25_00445 [Candidatus Pacebacteria bacterium]|nr:hypothetical protein [Candidatus Paceibacterota bacterium]